jgi:hypothetical protein
MRKRKQPSRVNAGGAEHISYTLDEILGDVGVTNFEHTSADGRRVHRKIHHLQPLSPVKNSGGNANIPNFPQDLYESFDTTEFNSSGGQVDFEPVEFETPRAKQYLSSVCSFSLLLKFTYIFFRMNLCANGCHYARNISRNSCVTKAVAIFLPKFAQCVQTIVLRALQPFAARIVSRGSFSVPNVAGYSILNILYMSWRYAT